jgi:outer membrane protein TolC
VARAAAVGMAGVAAASLLGGCVQDPMPFDPRLAQAWERRDDAQTRTTRPDPLPTTQTSQYLPGEASPRRGPATRTSAEVGGPVVKMTLQEVIHRAVANSLDIRVASFDTAIDQTRVLEAQANFDPTFFSDIGFQDVNKASPGGDGVEVPKGHDIFSNNASSAFTTIISRVDKEALTTFDAGFRQNLEAGGKIVLEQNVNNSWFFPTRSLLNPYYQDDLVLQLTQPLLQNFGVAVNQARITIARNTQRVSLLDFRKTVEDTVLKIEQTYWALLQAERDVQTGRDLVDASERTAQLLYYRQKEGQEVTAAQVNQANAQTEARRVELKQEQEQVGDLSDQLKLLMNDPAYPLSGNSILSPADDFQRDPLKFNLDDQIESALENRLELGQEQVRIDSSEVAVDVARNGLLPSLTLALTGTVDGVGRGFSDGFHSEGDFNHLGYSVELQFQLPIGNRAARAVWQRALLQRMQAIASYGKQIEQVTSDVQAAARKVRFSWDRLTEARSSVLSYQRLLDSLDAQRRQGDQQLTFDFVFNLLQDQEQLAAQQRAEHLAESDYNSAIAQLEQAKGTILRYDNVMMEQEPVPFDVQLLGSPAPKPTPPGYPYPDQVRGPLAP